MKYVFGDCDGEVEREDISELVEPAFPQSSDTVPSRHDSRENASSFFHIDAANKTSFTPNQAAQTSAYLKSIMFIDQLKKQIGAVAWEFPQSSKSRQETLCNERVYGHVNILMASGVVRLGDNCNVLATDREARRELLLRLYRDPKAASRHEGGGV